MHYRLATTADIAALAQMNQGLIRDEGHRNQMTIEQLAQRMSEFIAIGYHGVIFEADELSVGYALFRREPEWVYLRQFYVTPELRRRGIGSNALKWLRTNIWSDCPRVRIDVLVGNSAGIEFWRAVGFSDYCLTMELEEGN